MELVGAILAALQADADVITSLINEAQGVASRLLAQEKQAALQRAEVQERIRYYRRLSEVAANKILEAEMQAGKISQAVRKTGEKIEPVWGEDMKEPVIHVKGVFVLHCCCIS
jgi:chemotaxis regulatin CheY-phosphate phosphatase CheZ